ncbi:hypothetical protein JCM6882_007447 [Rhodosporidiobolus microsporus]
MLIRFLCRSRPASEESDSDESERSDDGSDSPAPAASFSSLPAETVRAILSILFVLQPRADPRQYLVDKRYYQLASSVKHTTFDGSPGGRDTLSRFLYHPRFNHADFSPSVREMTLQIVHHSPSLPFELPILSRLTNLTSVTLALPPNVKLPGAFIPALRSLPKLVDLSLVSPKMTAAAAPFFPSLQLKRDLPQIRRLVWTGPCPSRLFDDGPTLELLEIHVPRDPQPDADDVPFDKLPWSTLRCLRLVSLGDAPAQTELLTDALEAQVDQAEEEKRRLPLERLELHAQLREPALAHSPSSSFLKPRQYQQILGITATTSISYLRLPLSRIGSSVKQTQEMPNVRTLVIELSCHMETVGMQTLIRLIAGCTALECLELDGLVPYEHAHPVSLSRISGKLGGLSFNFPHLNALLTYLKTRTGVLSCTLRCPQVSDGASRFFRWTRGDRTEDFELDGWSTLEAK